MVLKRILVPTDFSPSADRALDHAIDLARPTKAQIIVLHVAEPVYAATADLYGASAAIATLLDEQIKTGRARLAQLAERLRRRRLRARTLLETGSPYQVIVDVARDVGADMVVMATHGRTGFAHLLLGSVTEKVVRTAACPVLTLRVAGGGRTRRSRAMGSGKRPSPRKR